MTTSLLNELHHGLTAGSAHVSIPYGTTIEEIEEALEFFDKEFAKEGDGFLLRCFKGDYCAYGQATNNI